jgi:hypothetical protein
MAPKPLPSAEHLRAVFRYDRVSGRLHWRARVGVRGARALAGQPAGGVCKGVWTVCLKGYGILIAHRVIWKMMHGVDPQEVDHKDGDPLNNRLGNLRNATRAQNTRNRGRKERAGYRGVSRQGNRWCARIRVDGRLIHLGSFADPESAYAAYVRAAKKHFGAFARLD